MAKYKFTGKTVEWCGRTLRQIERLSDGLIGGYIEAESNLDHSGDAWVFGNARVSGNAQVSGNAWVSGNAQVSGNAWVFGNAQVFGNAWVSGNAQVSGDAWVFGNARVFGDAQVFGNAWVSGNAQVSGNAWVSGNAKIQSSLDFLFIAGLRFSVTILNDGNMSIGCQTRTIREWLKATPSKELRQIERDEFARTQKIVKPIAVAFAKHHKLSLRETKPKPKAKAKKSAAKSKRVAV